MKSKTSNSKQTDPSVIDNDGLSWNEDYKGIRPNQDSAIASNIVAEVGRNAYRSFRFQVLRHLARTGPGLLNSLIQQKLSKK